MKINRQLIKTTKSSFVKADWWRLVQEEVKQKLEFIIDNLDVLGVLFKDAFIAAYKFEHAQRVIKEKSVNSQLMTVLFNEMSEESYQCSKNPVKCLLQLDDWIEPNDADVQACMFLCTHISTLELLK